MQLFPVVKGDGGAFFVQDGDLSCFRCQDDHGDAGFPFDPCPVCKNAVAFGVVGQHVSGVATEEAGADGVGGGRADAPEVRPCRRETADGTCDVDAFAGGGECQGGATANAAGMEGGYGLDPVEGWVGSDGEDHWEGEWLMGNG